MMKTIVQCDPIFEGLECLVSILKCMAEWSKDLYVNPNMQCLLTNERKCTEHNNNITEEHGVPLNGPSSMNNVNESDENSLLKQFEVQKQQKEFWETGIQLFNKNKPKNGISFLQERALLGRSVNNIAQWLLNEDRLDKTILGDFLGHHDEHCKEIMYAFIDLMDFSNMEFLSALRVFLEKFRLPGKFF